MANPKYADMPGIAHDQPDVYETSDLPESEQVGMSTSDVFMDQSESIEQIKVGPTEAFDQFKGKVLDASSVDFTDGISYRPKTGYEVRSGDWEMLGEGLKEVETPQQTYNRLQYEIKELLEQVTEMKEIADKESKGAQMSPLILTEHIENLQRDLQNLNMEQILGSEAIADLSDPQGTLHKKLLSQLEAFQKGSVQECKPKASTTSPGDSVTYELFMKPEQMKLEETSKVAELDQRLKKLENAIGLDKNKLSLLTSNTSDKSINAAINLMSAKLNLLDPGHLEQIETRLVVLNQCMQQLSEKKQQIDDVDKQNKIAELYELAKKVETMSSSLPQVVERLVALKELHEQALQFSKALTQLDTVQQQLSNSLQNNEKLLKELQGTFDKNTIMIKTNIEGLNARISSLTK